MSIILSIWQYTTVENINSNAYQQHLVSNYVFQSIHKECLQNVVDTLLLI